jgi:hypothetical protein
MENKLKSKLQQVAYRTVDFIFIFAYDKREAERLRTHAIALSVAPFSC